MKKLGIWRVVRRLAALAGGGVLLQSSGCAIDDATLTELLNLLVEAYLSSATTASY